MNTQPTGYVATCRCGRAVGALDLLRIDNATASQMLGNWLAQGRTVTPQFQSEWTVAISACTCSSVGRVEQVQIDATGSQPSSPIIWPKARDVGRIGDMSPSAHLRVGLDADNDVYVSVWDESGGGSVEFCNAGGGGGGRSHRTRVALINLMAAMEADNADRTDLDWWALRTGDAKGDQQ